MKKLFAVLIAGFISVNCLAQPPELLDNYWHMHELILDGESYFPYGSNVGFFADFYPGKTNDFTLEYHALHFYFIEIEFSLVDPVFESISGFGLADNNCANDPCLIFGSHYDDFYTDFGGFYEYEISSNSDGSETLVVTAPNGDRAIYNTFLLNTDNQNLSGFTIYPNPVSDLLFISSETAVIEKIAIYNLSGQLVLEPTVVDNSMDVSSLQQGIYFLEITSKNGKTFQKFIKE